MSNYNLSCSIKNEYTINKEEKILTKVGLTCDIYNVNLNIFHDRGYFLWIGSVEYKNHDWFNDVPRAMQK